MNETALTIIFGAIGAWNVALSTAIVKLMLWQVKSKVAIDIFIDSLGEKMAKALHDDDDHLQLDSLLDRYLDHNYDLSMQEWIELKNRCTEILNNKDINKDERAMAGLLAAVCEHKLMACGIKPSLDLKKK